MILRDPVAIGAHLEQLDKETRALKKELLDLCWYMRGGLTYTEALDLSLTEREIITEITKEHLELTKTSKMPFF